MRSLTLLPAVFRAVKVPCIILGYGLALAFSLAVWVGIGALALST